MVPNFLTTPAELFELLEAAATAPDYSIKEGDWVASFDFPFDEIHFGRSERTCGIIGQVCEITEPIEGCCRYRIRIVGFFRGDELETPGKGALECNPPVNGTLAFPKNRHTFGVIKLPPKG